MPKPITYYAEMPDGSIVADAAEPFPQWYLDAVGAVEKTTTEEIVSGYDGRRYLKSKVSEAPSPTPEQIQQQLTNAVQAHLDNKAQERGYDGILSLATYANSTNPQFSAEGLAGAQWRDDTWAACYVILDEVLSAMRTIPTVEELIAELPVLHWPDEAFRREE